MGGLFPRSNGEGAAGGSIPARSGTTFTDRRMKTSTVLYPNGARDSSVSLQDNEDYSRPVLRVSSISNFGIWPNTFANCVISSLPTLIKFGITILFDRLSFLSCRRRHLSISINITPSQNSPVMIPSCRSICFSVLPSILMGAAAEKLEIAAHEAERPFPHHQGTVLRVHALALARQNTLEDNRK